jgi:formylglycine-generating enzyme required for sulfatase activity
MPLNRSKTLRYFTILMAGFFLLPFAPVSLRAAETADTLALQVRVHENRADGCTDCGCRLTMTTEPRDRTRFWITFGLAVPQEGSPFSSAGSRSYCGLEAFGDVSESFTRTIGTPYLVVEVKSRFRSRPTGTAALELELQARELAAFDPRGRPKYESSTEQRKLPFARDGQIILPLLASSTQPAEIFAVHEVLLQIDVVALERNAAAGLGTLLVTGDVPGAAVLMDGGFVGRLPGNEPFRVDNVLLGNRQIRVIDFSGREASGVVQVAENAPGEIRLALLPQGETPRDAGILPIGSNPQGFREFWRTRDRATMVEVPAGPFLMGSPEGKGESVEWPQHEVDLPAFLIDKTEVTWRQFMQFAAEVGITGPNEPLWGKPDAYPASFILLDEALGYCAWAGGRLPTEAEWEKAARGTDGRVYPWGDQWDPSRCNTAAGGLHAPEAVGSRPACISPYGVLDVVGNVKEWTSDRYRDYPRAESAEQPGAEPSRPQYVMRGGGWMAQAIDVRVAYRHKRSPTSRLMDHGFRCVADIPENLP